MNARLRSRRPARWPFWLLIAAWGCANAPAIAVCAALAWLGEARHFSHQQRLVTDVAFVLTGHQAPGLGVAAVVKDAPRPEPLPVAPGEMALRKIDLAVERGAEVRPPAARKNKFVMSARAWPEARREPPPHQPPRAAAMS